jgi:hypothetical protein
MRCLHTAISSFLNATEIYFKTLAAFLLGAMAVIVSYYQYSTSSEQTKLIGRQTEIADAQKTLTEKQTELAKLQTDIAQVQVSPRFAFTLEGPPSHFYVHNLGLPTKALEGKCVVYVTFKNKGKTLELKNYYINDGEAASFRSGNLYFYHLQQGWYVDVAMYFFERNVGFETLQYVKLDYFDLAGQRRTEQYTMTTTGGDPRPAKGHPKIDAVFDFKKYRPGGNLSDTFDHKAATRDLIAFVESLVGKTPQDNEK